MAIDTKTVGELIDALITADIGCWMAQEKIMQPGVSDSECAVAAKRAQELNKRRNSLIAAIDRQISGVSDPSKEKTY